MKKYFAIYWGAVAILLLLWIRVEHIPIDMRITKDMFFVSCSMLSLLLFGFEREINSKIKYAMAYIFIAASVNQYFIVSHFVFTQWIFNFFGLITLSQFLSHLSKSNLKFFLNVLSASCIIQIAWIMLTKLGFDIYHEGIKLIYIKIAKNVQINKHIKCQ